jgi:hypothetical protein
VAGQDLHFDFTDWPIRLILEFANDSAKDRKPKDKKKEAWES